MSPYLLWLNQVEDRISRQYQLKRFPEAKYNVHLPGHGQLDNPFLYGSSIERISMDYDDPHAEFGTRPSPFPHDHDFEILEAPSGRTRLSKKAGPMIKNLLMLAITRRSIVATDDQNELTLDGYVEREIEYSILGIDLRPDQPNHGRLKINSEMGITWIVEHLIAPLTHHERSIAMESIIAHAVHNRKSRSILSFNEPLEDAARHYVIETWAGPRGSKPRAKAHFKYIAVLCESYLKHAYGLTTNYSLTNNDARSIDPLKQAQALKAPFTFDVPLMCTPEGWINHCKMVKKIVVHTLTLTSAKKDNQGRVQLYNNIDNKTNWKLRARPHYLFGEDELKAMSTLVMAYVGDPRAISKLEADAAKDSKPNSEFKADVADRNVRPRHH